MTSHEILLVEPIAAEALREFALRHGGGWQDSNDNPVFRQAVFTDGDAHLFIRGIDTQTSDLAFVSASDLDAAAKRCNAAICAVLTIDHTKGDEGDKLAGRVMSVLLSEWDGVCL
jgi:hypothetical protein